jgi:hypothetical protein
MMRRAVRLFVVLLAAGVTAAAAWRAMSNEQERVSVRQAGEAVDHSAEQGLLALAEFGASLHAYVAPGQGQDFWSTRAARLLDEVRERVMDLETVSPAAGSPLAGTLDAVDRLASAERRAREHVEAGQLLLAGDVVFTDARAIADGVAEAMTGARQAAARRASSTEAGLANEQSLLAGGVLAAWIIAAICLVPVHRPVPAPPQPRDLGRVLDLALDPPLSPAVVEPTRRDRATEAAEHQSTGIGVPDLTALAALCADFTRVSESAELTPLLARAGALLDAPGVIVWVVTPDGDRLTPAAVHGYDERTLARIGSIPLTGDNLTVTAFCRAAPLTRPSAGGTPGAVAVPLVSTSGPVGVLSAEVKPGVDADRAAAVAAVMAAPLATLFPAPTGGAESSPRHQRA